jgi:hypothetical protein
MLILEGPAVYLKYRKAIKALSIYINLCKIVILDNLSCSFSSIFVVANWYLRRVALNKQTQMGEQLLQIITSMHTISQNNDILHRYNLNKIRCMLYLLLVYGKNY